MNTDEQRREAQSIAEEIARGVDAYYNGHARDLNEDLRICAEATEGPRSFEQRGMHDEGLFRGGDGYAVMQFGDTTQYYPCAGESPVEADARFISEARAGWEHAIKRAIDAESALSAFQSSSARNFERACHAEAEVARLRILFREMLEHVSEPFIAYSDPETAVRFYAESLRQTVEYVHNTAKEALFDGASN